ncbi:hypothetical protein FSP39_019914 [Pinctada imbricata]|uniref:Plasminogen receptor (KT) n=1 Tax=Pinctada imbricata TaxID=66713 RepID=A0AA88XIZ1_PINIB|nr:hypothetical protein FSP39_019914 [Pinctada imbricata]
MGSVIGKAMDENMKKQQDFMLQVNKLTMERQVQMQNQMRERQMAMMVARSRDLFMWYSSFYCVVLVGGVLGFMKTKKPTPIIPLVPLTFIFGYQYDLAYGTKMERMRAEADRILDTEMSLIDLPHGLPTFATIEMGRLKQKDAERVQKVNDLYL